MLALQLPKIYLPKRKKTNTLKEEGNRKESKIYKMNA